jgi:hypothetical protein
MSPHFYVEFETTPGWEFVFRGQVQPAGFGGLAQVVRCHLSQTPHPGELGHGRMVTGTAQDQDAVGFDIPTVYFPDASIANNCLVFASAHPQRIAVLVPYRLVRRAFRTPLNESDPIFPVLPPSDDAVLTLAREAAARLWPTLSSESV